MEAALDSGLYIKEWYVDNQIELNLISAKNSKSWRKIGRVANLFFFFQTLTKHIHFLVKFRAYVKTKVDLPVLGNTDSDLYNQDILQLNLETGSSRHEPTRFLHAPEVKWGGNMIILNRIRHHVSPFPVNTDHCSKNFLLCAMTPIVTGFQKPNGDQLKCEDSCKKKST